MLDENLNIALTKFNRMYERVTSQFCSEEETIAVYSYGLNMKKMYPDFFKEDSFDEISQKIKALKSKLDLERYSQC